MKKKVAVITGASKGIGYACGKRLSKEYIIYNLSRTVKDSLFKSYEVDVNDYQRIKSIAKEIFENEGQIDLLINNAGFGIAGAVENCSAENIYSLVNTNLSAVITLSSIFIPYLKKTKGKIINISSIGGIIPLPYQAVYSATKAGVEIFSRALANEVKESGIKVTAILPGDIRTSFTTSRIIQNDVEDKEKRERIEKSIKKVEKDEQTGMSADSVAKVVQKIAKKKNPPLRKSVGLSYKFVSFLSKVLPTRVINFIVRKLYCK